MKISGFLAFVLPLLLSGCVKEEWTSGCDVAEGTTRIALSIGVAEQVTTRSDASANECKINDAYLLLFDAAGKYKNGEKIPASQINSTNVKAPVITTQLGIGSGDKIVVLLNTGVATLPSGLKVGTTITSQINALFPATAWNLNPTNEGTFGQGLPMSGETTFVVGTTPTVPIRRSVAKIQLNVNIAPGDDSTGHFANLGNISWGIYNVLNATRGAIYTPDGSVTTISGLTTGDFSNNAFSQTAVGYSTNYKQTFYMPQYPSAVKAKEVAVSAAAFNANRTCMILRVTLTSGGYKYYRIDLYDHATKMFIDIRRNTHILVTITKVKSVGYDTPAEALANSGSNLEYEVKIAGDNDNIIISNGQHALVLDYDEVIYTGDASTEISFGSVRGIDATGIGLPATKTITASSGVTLTGATSISTTAQELKATMSGTSGTITIKLGYIERVLKLSRSDAIPASGSTITLTGDYSGVTWTKLSPNIRLTLNGTTSMTVDADEGITLKNASALSDPAVVPVFESHSAGGYIFHSGSTPGRAKISILQSVPECVGWFGGDPDNSFGRYSKRLIIDSHDAPTALQWYVNTNVTTNTTDKEVGLNNTKALMALSDHANYKAARYCYMLNDRSGNGVIDSDESVDWYLPAQNQLMSLWITKAGLNTSFSASGYWSSTEGTSYYSWYVDFATGRTSNYGKTNDNYVRCVRDL